MILGAAYQEVNAIRGVAEGGKPKTRCERCTRLTRRRDLVSLAVKVVVVVMLSQPVDIAGEENDVILFMENVTRSTTRSWLNLKNLFYLTVLVEHVFSALAELQRSHRSLPCHSKSMILA